MPNKVEHEFPKFAHSITLHSDYEIYVRAEGYDFVELTTPDFLSYKNFFLKYEKYALLITKGGMHNEVVR